MKLSIIIPVYNVQQYIGKCLESCLNQNLSADEYEIVVVNDGSPDDSVAVVEQYIQKASNIRLVNRENGGLSAARNTGLKEAKGEYVWFVDSDDWIEPYCIGELMSYATEQSLDVLCINLQLVFDDNYIEAYTFAHEELGKVYDGQKFICKVNMPPAAVCGIYRRQYLLDNDFLFKVGILHEDMEFTPRIYCMAERIAFIDKPIYNYLQRSGSIMKSNRNIKRCKDLLTICDSLYDFVVNRLDKGSAAYHCMMAKIAFVFSQSVFFYATEAFPLREYKNKPYYPVFIDKNLSLIQQLKYRLLNLSIPLYLKIQRLGK